MIKHFLAAGLLVLLASCSWGYGSLRDYSKFVSAKLLDDKKSILFTYHRYTYRPATGWRAFPDGGIPRYEQDRNLIGIYDLARKKVTILRRENNRDWQAGSGRFTIHAVNGTKALLAQGGQLRGAFKLGLRYLLLDLAERSAASLDLKGDLARRGRDCGEIYLAAPDGTLLFVTQPLSTDGDSRSRGNNVDESEIWVRTAGGDYLKVAAAAMYETVRNGEAIYWIRATRQFHAFSLSTLQSRPAPEFKYGDYVDVTEGVSLAADRKGLEYGTKVNGVWQYQPLEIAPHLLK
ncbi:MAG: hypothetical protein EG822_05275 [Deltaproteobacteria bacterium]|nr:hypothetical protein [Deltaproteobacteria bacterium]TLN04393.1 MAG: hypothetical protein FDZ73_03665 [bacterium]